MPNDYISSLPPESDEPIATEPGPVDNMSRTVTSRKAKTEQKKLIRQTVIMGGGAVLLGLVFIVVIAPSLIRFVGGLFGNSTLETTSDTLPPQVPILAAPVSATNSATLSLSGYGEGKSKLVVIVNGSKTTEQNIPDDGGFKFDITLTEGENSLNVYSVDEAGNESAASKSYMVTVDSEAPKLEITEPQEGQQIELRKNQLVTIKGTTEPKAKVFVNGRLVLAGDDGTFSTTYLLQEGENKLEMKAVDLAGNETTSTLTVQFRF